MNLFSGQKKGIQAQLQTLACFGLPYYVPPQ